MSKAMLKAGLVAASISVASSAVMAAEGQFYLAPGIQWFNFDNGLGFEHDEGPALGVGYDFTDRLSGEVTAFDLDPVNAQRRKVDIDQYRADVYYRLFEGERRIDPFITSGFGNLNIDGDNDTLWDVGTGVSIKLTDRLSWRTAVRSYRYLGRDFEDGDVGVDSALIFRFGGPRRTPASPAPQAAAAPAAVADSDGDGVPDSRDACSETPRTYAVDDRGCPIQVEEVARLELQVNFDFDRDVVKPEFLPEIRRVADFMSQYPEVIVELEGHTDSTGPEPYNQDLSQRRVNAVRDVLIGQFGISSSRITATGYGEMRPVASNSTAAGRAQNRRVVSVLIKTLQRFETR